MKSSTPSKVVRGIEYSERIYRQAIRLYPQSHQRDYGALMMQLFRDQCRDAHSSTHKLPVMKMWLRMLPDLGMSVINEHYISLKAKGIMNVLKSKVVTTILFVVALAGGFAAVQSGPTIISKILLAIAAIALLSHAGFEFLRNGSGMLWMMARTAALMIIWGIYLPMLAKQHMDGMPYTPWLEIVTVVCLFANPLVVLIRVGEFVRGRLRVR